LSFLSHESVGAKGICLGSGRNLYAELKDVCSQ
jgi:hypothetical protein